MLSYRYLEGGVNPDLRKVNWQKIVGKGIPLIESSRLNVTNAVSLGPFDLKSGLIYPDVSLSSRISNKISQIKLYTPNMDLGKYLIHPKLVQDLVALELKIETTNCSGSGVGSALFHLGEEMINRIIFLCGFTERYSHILIYSYDSTQSSIETSGNTGWITSIMSEYGYSNTPELIELLNSHSDKHKILIKEFQ